MATTAEPLLILSSVSSNSELISHIPISYCVQQQPTALPSCFPDVDSLACPGSILLGDSDTGSAELNTSKVFAWNREVNIAFSFALSKVRQVNLFFYNIPSSGIGLPPAEFFWSNVDPLDPDIPLSHVIVGNQELSQDDRTENVSLVVTTDQSDIPDYRYFRIRFTFPAESSLIEWILLSEIQLCGEVGMCVSVFLMLVLQHAPSECQVYLL